MHENFCAFITFGKNDFMIPTKFLLITFLFSTTVYCQQLDGNYIEYYNWANEAEYYFHEDSFDTAVDYFERGFSFVAKPHPSHQVKYARALWKIGREKDALMQLYNNQWINQIDTACFSGIPNDLTDSLNAHLGKNIYQLKRVEFVRAFVDSVMRLDQAVRQLPTEDSLRSNKMRVQDSLNGLAVLEFTKKHGFPGGKNAGWDQTVGLFLLHASPEWFIENYSLLITELKAGNIEPYSLARGIDRAFVSRIGNDKIVPYNRYWSDGSLHPFLVFQNCVAIGVSPYYNLNWLSTPVKTKHFDYYKKNKAVYSTVSVFSKDGEPLNSE